MDDDILNKAVNQIKEIKMTTSEKERVLKEIFDLHKTEPRHSIHSPYIGAFFSKISLRHFSYVGVAICLVLLLTGGVVSAQASLPGSTLYPIKVGVVEPLRAALIFSPVKKIKYETKLATERIIEAEMLASRDELNESHVEKLNELLENHTNAFNSAVYSMRAKGSPSPYIDDDFIIGFEARMNAHARVLDLISERENLGKDIADSEFTSKHTKLSQTAREKAATVANNLRNNKDHNDKTIEERYKKRKDAVRSLIDSTTKDIAGIRSQASPHGKKIADHTDTILNQAKQLLKEGEDKEKNGDAFDAYNKILDSESSAKEAEIFLKAGLRLPDVPEH